MRVNLVPAQGATMKKIILAQVRGLDLQAVDPGAALEVVAIVRAEVARVQITLMMKVGQALTTKMMSKRNRQHSNLNHHLTRRPSKR